MKRVVFASALTAAVMMASSAFAAPVNWNVTGTWNDGGLISGSFIYDADTGVYSAVSISVTGGALPAVIYVAENPPFSGPNLLGVVTSGGTGAGQRVAQFSFSAPLTNAGGSVLLGPTTAEGVCNVGCTAYAGGPARTIAGGVATTAPAPVPTLGEWAMIGFAAALAAMGGLFISGRRRVLRVYQKT